MRNPVILSQTNIIVEVIDCRAAASAHAHNVVAASALSNCWRHLASVFQKSAQMELNTQTELLDKQILYTAIASFYRNLCVCVCVCKCKFVCYFCALIVFCCTALISRKNTNKDSNIRNRLTQVSSFSLIMFKVKCIKYAILQVIVRIEFLTKYPKLFRTSTLRLFALTEL